MTKEQDETLAATFAELKPKWLVALRSGDYPQDTSQLRTKDGFCCLGVLADIIDPTLWNNDAIGSWGPDGSYGSPQNATLAPEVCGLSRCADNGEEESPQDLLASMNDTGSTFAEIADYIEANL